MIFYLFVPQPEVQVLRVDLHPYQVVKTGAGSSAKAAAHSLAWVDVAREALQRGAEEARLAHGG